jgi:Ca2+-binding EF-hand superfamily protein
VPLAFGQGQRQMDRDRSGAVESYEWPYNPELFRQLDKDGDGALTSVEFRSFTQLTIVQLDTNKNGQLDPNEWPGRFADFKRLDQNGDGRVTAEEYFTRGGGYAREQRFREWDRNSSGFIESTEWRSDNILFFQFDRDGDSRISPEEFQNRAPREFVADLDRNNNGVIERSEWKGSGQSFREFDANGDNAISQEEFMAGGTRAEREQRFSDIDRNDSGVIEGNEWRGDREVFHRLDINGDSVLEVDEYISDTREAGFHELDSNSDGFVSRMEWTGTARRFNQLDQNRDGWLSQWELFSAER